MDIQDRIQTVIKVNKLNASTFAERIGVQRSSVSHILNGRNKPSLDFLQKVLDQFPRVDAGWLVSGRSPGTDVYPFPSDNLGDTGHEKPVPEQGYEGRETSVNDHETHREGAQRLVGEGDAGEESNKRISKIVVFYTDHTFEEYRN